MCVRVLFLNYKKKKCAEEFKSVLWPFEQPKRRTPWQYQAREFPISGRMSTHPLGVSICCWWRILSVASFCLAARSLWASAAGAWKQDGRPWRVYFEGGEAVSPPCIKSTQKKMFGLKDAGNWFIMQRGGCLKQKVSAKAVRTTTSVFWLVEGRRGAESAKRAWTAAAAPVITWFVYLFGRKTRTSIGGPCCTLNRNLLLKWWRNPNTSAIRWADLGNFSSIEQKKKMRNCDVAAFYWSDDAIHMRSWSSDNWLTWKKRKRKKMRLLLSRDVGGGWQVTGEHEAFTCRFSCFFLFKSKKGKKGLLPDDVVIERGRNRWENCGRSAMNRWRATHIKEQMLSSAGGWRKRQQPVTARHQFLTFPLAERASARSGPATRESGRGHWTTEKSRW